MSSKTLVLLYFDSTVWTVLDSLNPRDGSAPLAYLKEGTPEHPTLILVHCQRIEDTTYGFLRLVPVEATENLPLAVAVPVGIVAAMIESDLPLPAGFLP